MAWRENSATWPAVLPQLSKKYRVVAPDLFGHGESAKPRGDSRWVRSRHGCVICSTARHHPGDGGRSVAWWRGGNAVHLPASRLLSTAGSHQQRRPGPRPELDIADTVGTRSRAGAAGGRPPAGAERRQQAGVLAHSAGVRSPRAGEIWSAYSSLSDGQSRQAFLRTLRSVVDYRGQAVSALNKLHLSSGILTLLIWGDQDRIIPVAHWPTPLTTHYRIDLWKCSAASGALPARRVPATAGGVDPQRLHRHHGTQCRPDQSKP